MTTEQRNMLRNWKNQQAQAAEAARMSANRQRRIMRHLGRETDPTAARWEALMALCGRINREVAPVLKARQAAEEAIFQIKTTPEPKKPVISKKITTKPTVTENADWWKEAEDRERAVSKAFTAAALGYGLKRKHVLAAIERFEAETNEILDPCHPAAVQQLPALVAFMRQTGS